jgi:predicted RecA/RadA family phage recombinase
MATYVAEGMSIPYTPGSAVAAGDVAVVGDIVGVAPVAIAANVLGTLAVSGIHIFPKATGGGAGIAAGAVVYWNTSTLKAQTTASTFKRIGKTVLISADADTTVKVLVSM